MTPLVEFYCCPFGLERDDIAFAQPSRSSALFDRVIQTFGDSAYSHHAVGSFRSPATSGLIPNETITHPVLGASSNATDCCSRSRFRRSLGCPRGRQGSG